MTAGQSLTSINQKIYYPFSAESKLKGPFWGQKWSLKEDDITPRANRYFLPGHVWHITPAVTKKNSCSSLSEIESVGYIGYMSPRNALDWVHLAGSGLHYCIIIFTMLVFPNGKKTPSPLFWRRIPCDVARQRWEKDIFWWRRPKTSLLADPRRDKAIWPSDSRVLFNG